MDIFTTVLELVGVVLIVAAVALVSVPAGLAVAGAGCILVGVRLAPRPAPKAGER